MEESMDETRESLNKELLAKTKIKNVPLAFCHNQCVRAQSTIDANFGYLENAGH